RLLAAEGRAAVADCRASGSPVLEGASRAGRRSLIPARGATSAIPVGVAWCRSQMPPPITRSSGAELPADGIAVGRIDGAYGVKGAVRVVTFNDPEDSVLG